MICGGGDRSASRLLDQPQIPGVNRSRRRVAPAVIYAQNLWPKRAAKSAVPDAGVPGHGAAFHRGGQVIPARLKNDYQAMLDVSGHRHVAEAEEDVICCDAHNKDIGSDARNGTRSSTSLSSMQRCPDIRSLGPNNPGTPLDGVRPDQVQPCAEGLCVGLRRIQEGVGADGQGMPWPWAAPQSAYQSSRRRSRLAARAALSMRSSLLVPMIGTGRLGCARIQA